jgi:hypothetical protein
MNEPNPSLEIQRLSALSDGIFAVSMTLLAFSIHLPESSAAGRLANELTRMCQEGIGLVVSFWIAAMFWLSHLRLFQLLQRADFGFRLLNFALLLSIVVLPISTSFDTTFFQPNCHVRHGRQPWDDFVDEPFLVDLRRQTTTSRSLFPCLSRSLSGIVSVDFCRVRLRFIFPGHDLATNAGTESGRRPF